MAETGRSRWGDHYSSVYQDPRWYKARAAVLHRDGYKCWRCGGVTDLQVDHIVPVTGGGDLFDEDNMQCLCGTCNRGKRVEDRLGYSQEYDISAGMFTDPRHPSNVPDEELYELL